MVKNPINPGRSFRDREQKLGRQLERTTQNEHAIPRTTLPDAATQVHQAAEEKVFLPFLVNFATQAKPTRGKVCKPIELSSNGFVHKLRRGGWDRSC